MIDFPEGKYRSPFCHQCREDAERMKKAMDYDTKPQSNLQQKLKCVKCEILLVWWWFGKLPLTQEEKTIIMNKPIRPGRAF